MARGGFRLPSAARGRAKTPPEVTQSAPHIRDAADLDWVMRCIVIALVPTIAIGLFNTGYQVNMALARAGADGADGWRGAVLEALGVSIDPANVLGAVLHGLLYMAPVLIVASIVGGAWERLFAVWRKREASRGLLVIALLFTLSLPPAVPLWQVALGISFGIVVGREIFGGTGKNFLNPVLVGLAFLYASYPQGMVGEAVWRAVDAYTGPTVYGEAVAGETVEIAWLATDWLESFFGLDPGTMGAGSAFAAILGAGFLIYRRVASPRIMAAVAIGMVVVVLLFNQVGGEADQFWALPWFWHLTVGSFAFGAVFLATDPASASATETGQWVYGLLIGAMVVVIRVANPAHPDGVLFAILLGNIFAPLIDHAVVWAHIRKRARRDG